LKNAEVEALRPVLLPRPPTTPHSKYRLYYIDGVQHLPSGQRSVLPFLFPPCARDSSRPGAQVIGFDAEWRSQLGGVSGSLWNQKIVPVSVVQLSSCHATIVINLVALGKSMLDTDADLWASCREALGVVREVFGDPKCIKVGLHCEDDIKRMRVLNPGLAFCNVVDCEVPSLLLLCCVVP
jgi:hypothetical protein